MEKGFFESLRESFSQMSCIKRSGKADIHNYSTVIESDLIHTRNNSSATEENHLSQTQPLPRFSAISEQPELQLQDLEQILTCIKSNNTVMCRKYLNSGANLLSLNKKNRTYLHVAAKGGALEACQLLVAYSKIGINAKDDDLRTAAHLATIKGHVEVVQYLHRCGAYLHIKDKLGNTVIDYAIEGSHGEIVQYVIGRSPSIGKGLGAGIARLLRAKGIPSEPTKKVRSNESGKAKRLEDFENSS